jgi:hypothetical protein
MRSAGLARSTVLFPESQETAMSDFLDDAQWAQCDRDGYLLLGRIIEDADLSAMQRRIDDIMLGRAAVD